MTAPPALCDRVRPLAGHHIGVTADRRAEEQAELLTRMGARVLHGAVMRTLPLGDDTSMRAATDALLASPPDITLLTTGIGVRSWFAAAETWGVAAELADALASGFVCARGPKAVAASLPIGLRVDRREPTEKLDAMIASLDRDGALAGAHVAIQLYGNKVPWAVDALEAAGARVTAVPIYVWVPPEDDAPARRLVHEAADGHLSAVTFTCPAAVEQTMTIAEEAGRADELRAAFATTVAAVAVGPVTAAAAARVGVALAAAPAVGRLGLMVRALVAALDARHQHLLVADGEVIVRGALVHDEVHSIELATKERAVLHMLARSPGSVATKTALAQQVWGSPVETVALDATVARLRRKLGPLGVHIVSRPRRGYQLDAVAASCSRAVPVSSATAPAP